jgi:spore coat polysaccharide biosynthesis protein SpsF
MQNLNLVVLQARMSSTRLPGKVLSPINGQPMIYWEINRILRSKLVDKFVVAISEEKSDDILAEYLKSIQQEFIRGSLNNVLARYILAAEMYKPTLIVRITADCPFVMPELIDVCISRFYLENVDYLSNALQPTFPHGLDIEVFAVGVLKKLQNLNLTMEELEHVTLGIYGRKEIFTTFNIPYARNLSHFRWTVDVEEDLHFTRRIYEFFKNTENLFNFQDMLALIQRHPELNQIKYR